MKMDIEKFDIASYLSALPIFSNLSKQERENLAQECTLQRRCRSDMIFRAGDTCDEFHIIIMGQAKLFAATPAGQEKVIELIGPGQSFAEAMLFLNKPHMLNAQTLTDSLLISISKKAIFGEIARDSRFSMHLLTGISRRLHELQQEVEGYTLHSGMRRLISYLLRDVDGKTTPHRGAFTVSLPVSKATVASRLSLTPEYFSRVLHELETKQLIEINKREIRIFDVPRLMSYGAH